MVVWGYFENWIFLMNEHLFTPRLSDTDLAYSPVHQSFFTSAPSDFKSESMERGRLNVREDTISGPPFKFMAQNRLIDLHS